MKAKKKPIQVWAKQFANMSAEEFVQQLEYPTDEEVYVADENTIKVKKSRGEISLTRGNWMLYELKTDRAYWAIDHEIFKKTYKHLMGDIYQKKGVVIEFERLGSLADHDIVPVLNFLNSDETVNQVKEQGFVTVDTLEGIEKLWVGEVVIKGVEGEFYPVMYQNFLKVYEILK